MSSNYQPPGNFITHMLKNGFKRHRSVKAIGDNDVHELDLTPLGLNVGRFVPFIIPKGLANHEIVTLEQLENILPNLGSEIDSHNRDFVVLLIGGTFSGEFKKFEETELIEQQKVVLIDNPVAESIYKIDDIAGKENLLCLTLVKYLGREALSPYISGRPAIGGRFFARSADLKRVLTNKSNCTIIGNRRIGKTSLLREISDRLKLQKINTTEVYGGKCSSTLDAIYELLVGLNQFRTAEHLEIDPYKVRNFPSYVRHVSESTKNSVAIFVDELDHILEFDSKQDYEFLHLLRATSEQNASCRIFLAGFRKVMEAKISMDTPLFNFTRPIELALFSREETVGMVTKPLVNLDVDLTGSDLPETIYAETGGHPELIQIYCAEVIRLKEANGSVPTGGELISAVINNQEHKQKVLGTFLANTNPYEELLCYLLIADAYKSGQVQDYDFGPKEVNRVLEAVKINLKLMEIMATITNLKVSGIITSVAGRAERYKFSAPRLVGYCLSLDLEFCISKALNAVKGCSDKVLALWSEPGNYLDNKSGGDNVQTRR